jgi:hypothetical protein
MKLKTPLRPGTEVTASMRRNLPKQMCHLVHNTVATVDGEGCVRAVVENRSVYPVRLSNHQRIARIQAHDEETEIFLLQTAGNEFLKRRENNTDIVYSIMAKVPRRLSAEETAIMRQRDEMREQWATTTRPENDELPGRRAER